MKSSTKMLTYILLVTSTLMVLSSNNWITMWLGLEVNLMSFIPIMFEAKNNILSQSCMMYFLSQSMGSVVFLSLVLFKKYLETMDMEVIYSLIMLSMSVKLGMPPFHFWMPQLMEKIKWENCVILMTWQKLAPMLIMSYVVQQKMALLLIVSSTLTGAIMGINQTSMRKIMAYSTMTHMGWMVASMKTSEKTWVMYFIMYTMIIIPISIYCLKLNIMVINQVKVFTMNLMEKISFITLMMSLGGLPPFFGFLPKWIVLNDLVYSKELFLMIILLLMNLIPLFYYIRICTNMNMFLSQTQKWVFPSKSNTPKYVFFLNTMMAPLILTLTFL